MAEINASWGDVEKALIETAGQGHGPFHQTGNLVQQRLVGDGSAPHRVRRPGDLGVDGLPARLEIGDDIAVIGQQRAVVPRPVHGQGLGMMEAVTAGLRGRWGCPGTGSR